MKKGKRNGWFALCGKSINNDLIDNDKIRAKFYGK
ncbi:hypothetical protein ACS0TV_24515 [Klebsiella pneumoniae]